MNIISNFPENPDNIIELQSIIVNFHATLLIHKIQSLNIDDKSKKNILTKILEDLEKKDV